MKIKDGQSGQVSIKQEAGAVANIDLEQFADAGFDSISPNTAFADGGTITRGSKMNDDVEDPGGSPF